MIAPRSPAPPSSEADRFEPTPLALDAALARRTWALSEQLTRERGLVLAELQGVGER